MDRLLPKSAAHFDDPDFHMPDQDVLNAILQSSDAPIVSLQFPDWWSAVALHNPFLHVGAMARTAFYHSIGAKPWNLRTVPPRIPSPYEALWYRHTALEPGPLRVSCEVPPSVRRWLAGSWSGRFTSRAKRLSQRLVGG